MWYQTIETFALGPLHLRVWGMLVATGVAAGLLLTARIAHRRGIDRLDVWTLGVVVVGAGVLGSRVLWALQPAMIDETLSHPWRALAVWEPGLTLIGGVLAAVLAGIVYVRRSGISPLVVADMVAPGFALGLFIGRLGCFLTGLHPGRPTTLPWGIFYLGEVRHPIPLYEALLGLVILGLGLVLLSRRLAPGLAALGAVMAYVIGRSLLDLLRAPGLSGADPRLVGGVTLTQGLALPIGLAALGLLLVLLRRHRRTRATRSGPVPSSPWADERWA